MERRVCFAVGCSKAARFRHNMMNDDYRKLNDDGEVSAQQQHQQQDELITTTRLTPFSIDNILGRSRDLAPANQQSPVTNIAVGGLTGNSRASGDSGGQVGPTTTSRTIQTAASITHSTGEIITSSNLDELQSLLNSKLRHQHQPPLPPPPPPPHHHHHHYHPHHSSHLSQQQTAAMPTSFYTQFHRHLNTLPSSIDGMRYGLQTFRTLTFSYSGVSYLRSL